MHKMMHSGVFVMAWGHNSFFELEKMCFKTATFCHCGQQKGL